ncbi:WD40/YVTN/BNR-like repeat-containing protein [Synoicihabitans lomoniglobus]|uniref:Photosynthesis system II assembly factor Ycf48/Hcf136-like domain-containing protein n=1 Tax=Synoicihabitans lomoniglobus TaxID=2909285 RepID=A0AAE9ZX46_9BACT|nr:hypothetical protein [Opitutaceae bacterium LMO-M01]WED64510.1 hypothetical protein PXH66_19390 [Opitutaceae bacterium LMO-M01]
MPLFRTFATYTATLSLAASLGFAAIEFETVHTSPGGASLRAVTATEGRLVAVGTSGRILTSTDAVSWTETASPTATTLHGVTYGLGTFIAVGEAGTILASVDGSVWDLRTSPVSTRALRAIAFANGRFIAVGDEGAMLSSTDGQTWALVELNESRTFRHVAASDGFWPFIALGDDGLLLHSLDGHNWSRPSVYDTETRDYVTLVEFGDPLGYYYLTRQGNGTLEQGVEYRRRDGTAFTTNRSGALNYLFVGEINGAVSTLGGGLAFGVDGSLFHQSANGGLRSWRITDSSTSADLYGAVEHEGRAIIVGDDATIVRSRPLRSGRLINLSTRGVVEGDTHSLVAGFVISGEHNQTCLIRAIGPGLAQFDVSDVLTKPRLELYNRDGQSVAANEGWDSDPVTTTAIVSAADSVGAFALEAGSADAAILIELPPGIYTARVSSANPVSTGLALVEVYHRASNDDNASALVNLSTRGIVRAGENNQMIAGFSIGGDSTRRVLIRAVGPTLAAFGLSGTLQEPEASVTADGFLFNSPGGEWTRPNGSSDEIRAAAVRAGAFPLREDSQDVAWVTELRPGEWTVLVRSEFSGEGVALVEIYDITE